MQHKFTKSLLATAILFGLTACGSSGGGGSSEPTTKANAAVDTAQNTTVNKSNATNTAKDNSKKEETITVPTVADNTNKNNATNQPIKNTTEPKAETKPVTAIKNIENLSGKATYTAQLDKSQSYINGERKSGKVELTADFDHKDISGKATFDMSGGYTYSTGRACRFNGQSACGTIRAYNSARANLKETLLTNNNGVLSFNGVAEGKIDEYGEITPIVGTYQGQISGENAENISGSITANSSAIYGVFNGTSEKLVAQEEKETISIPVVENQNDKSETTSTESNKLDSDTTTSNNANTSTSVDSKNELDKTENTNTGNTDKNDTVTDKVEEPIVTNWEDLLITPKITSSKIDWESTSKITGKATYFSQQSSADLKNGEKTYSSKTTPNTYTVLNADFDNRKVSGSSAIEFYQDDNKVGQAQINLNETNLYKDGSFNWSFNGNADGKIQVQGKSSENISGNYSGNVITSLSGQDRAKVNYSLSSDLDKSIKLTENTTKENLKIQ